MIKTAIVPVAGYGTRRLPITKVIEKCMLPIGNRPIIDYVVDDCVRAGITEVYFVVSEDSTQIREYFGRNEKLEQYLENQGKTAMLSLIEPRAGLNVHFVKQPNDGKYGTSIPVAIVAEQIGFDEPVVVVMGDDFLYHKGDDSDIKNLIEKCGDGEASMLGVEVPHTEVSKYGVIEKDEDNKFVQIVEKPSADEAPSNLINVSKYVMPPKLLKLIAEHYKTEVEGEYLITDPINEFVNDGGIMRVVPAVGEYMDGGTLAGWLRANEIVGKDLLK
jgi:UTP--glucose-1-phosphate uridylyltransferase